MIKIGDTVFLKKPAKKVHPWRRNKMPYVGKGVVVKIREVQKSSWVTDGKIYVISWRGKERDCVISSIKLAEEVDKHEEIC